MDGESGFHVFSEGLQAVCAGDVEKGQVNAEGRGFGEGGLLGRGGEGEKEG